MAPGTAPRWMGIGHVGDPHGTSAGREAVRQAARGRAPALVLLFASHIYDLGALLAAAEAEVPDGTPVAGCTTAGELSGNGPTTSGLVAVAIGGDGIEAAISVGEDASKDPRGAGVAAAAAVLGVEGLHRALILLTPGLVPRQEEIVRGAYAITGATVPILGGAAGDGLTLSGSHQLVGGRGVLADAVVGVGIASEGPIGVAIGHGWRRVGEPLAVKSDGSRIDLLDDRPALDVYLERLQVPAEVADSPEALNRFALLHPLGLDRVNGEDVRVPGEVDLVRRSLICTAEVPQGGVVWLMEGDEVSVVESAAVACDDARAGLQGSPPFGAVVFDCVGRRLVLGSSLDKEAAAVSSALGEVPFGGFYTYGEIARVRGSSGVHNETFVVMALA